MVMLPAPSELAELTGVTVKAQLSPEWVTEAILADRPVASPQVMT